MTREDLEKLAECGIIGDIDAAVEMMREKEQREKEKKVLSVHRNEIQRVSLNGKIVYQTRCGKKRPRCTTYEALIEKLYEIYFGDADSPSDYSFGALFPLAVEQHQRATGVKEKTVRDYYFTYEVLFPESFRQRDIRRVLPSDVQAFILETVKEHQLTEKRLLKLKGVLNMVFDYALERGYISRNPVPVRNDVFRRFCRQSDRSPEAKAFSPDEVFRIREFAWRKVKEEKYNPAVYAVLFASETGMREGELPALRWDDVAENRVHIHAQLCDEKVDGKTVYYYSPTTKDEKGISRGGRFIPMTESMKRILSTIKNQQMQLGIVSEFVFCKADGSWLPVATYRKTLWRMTRALGLSVTNNHAFRMALNSYVLIPLGLPETERARILGHSPETNLRFYALPRETGYLDDIARRWDEFEALPRPYLGAKKEKAL